VEQAARLLIGATLFDQLSHLGGWGRLVGFCIAILYFGTLNSVVGKGQTLGKRILKIHVIMSPVIPRALLHLKAFSSHLNQRLVMLLHVGTAKPFFHDFEGGIKIGRKTVEGIGCLLFG